MINGGKKSHRTNATVVPFEEIYTCYTPNNHTHEEKVQREINQNINIILTVIGGCW